jgi:translation initiation factor IF-2
VEYVVLAFPGNKFKGDILPALGDLVEQGIIRVMDLAFVKKDADGTVVALELENLNDDEASPFAAFEKQIGDLLSADDLMEAAAMMEPNSSAAVLVWENVWAARFAETVREAGGILVDNRRIPYDVVQAALDDVTD